MGGRQWKAASYAGEFRLYEFLLGTNLSRNLVSHEAQISETINQPGFPVHTYWHYLRDPVNRVSILQNSWVRWLLPKRTGERDGTRRMSVLFTVSGLHVRLTECAQGHIARFDMPRAQSV